MSQMINSDSWKGGEVAFQRQRLASNFALHDVDGSGFLERTEIEQALREAGYLMSSVSILQFMLIFWRLNDFLTPVFCVEHLLG
jgi:hypothetical protein